MSQRTRSSVQRKLILIMVSTLLLVSASTIASVVWMTDAAMVERQKDLEQQIRTNLQDKGRLLANSHATALGPLVADNALSDVQKLVGQTVGEDGDIIYGLYLTAEKRPWAYVSPTSKPAEDDAEVDMEAWKELKIGDLKKSERDVELFGQEILEFAQPVVFEEEEFGTLRYGISVVRLKTALESSRRESEEAKARLIQVLAVLGAAIFALGLLLITQAARRLTQPLALVTDAAKKIAQGDRSHRVAVHSGDEVELLAGAFNDMLEENEKQFAALEKTTEQALAASRLKSEFLANMSHEIRTPMNGVLGMIKLILRHPLDTKVRRYADTVQASANALMTIINDILDFSKMEAGKYTLQHASFDLRIIVQEVSELLSTRALENGVELIYRVDPRFPSLVSGDPDRFRQVLNNLVGNAVKFTEQGEVFVDVTFEETEDEKVRCIASVSDSGIGIPKEALETLFDAFSQADGSMVRKHGGTGLGLTISQRLAKMMGGKIQVESTPGVGSKFTVDFLFDVESKVSTRRNLNWTEGKKICVLEPSPRWAKVIREHLGVWGLDSLQFRQLDEGFDALLEAAERDKSFDAVLVGIQLSDNSAKEFISRLRKTPTLKELPVIALTQLGTSATLSEVAGELQAQIQKPLRLSELFNALQSAFLGKVDVSSSIPPAEREERKTDRPVLVVDDNEINQLVAVEELEFHGYATEVANHGAEALEKVKSKDYLLVLMDCQMPVMDGYTATREIRKHEGPGGKHTPIIALTAHAMAGERERVLSAGMDDYLSKPFRPESLHKVMKHHGIQRVSGVSLGPRARATSSLPPKRPSTLPPEAAEELDPEASRSAKLIALFLKNVPGQINDLKESVAAGDAVKTRAVAHKLKGSCLALVANPMASAAETLQHQSDKGDLSCADELIDELETRFKKVAKLLDAELKSKQ